MQVTANKKRTQFPTKDIKHQLPSASCDDTSNYLPGSKFKKTEMSLQHVIHSGKTQILRQTQVSLS